jgi:hypothetical protein
MLETIIGHFGSGGAKLSSQGKGGLKSILKELQGLRIDVVTGANSGSMIFPGIRTTDTILKVLAVDGDAAQLADSVKDVTANVSIASMHRLTCDTNLSAYQLIVFWYDKDSEAATTTTTTTTSTTSSTTSSTSTTTSTTSTTTSSTTTTTTTAP